MVIAPLDDRYSSGKVLGMKAKIAARRPTAIEENPAVIDFVRRVSQIPEVRCVVAEPEDGAIHLTTFASPLTEATQDAIFAIEASTIDSYLDQLFDFHLRDAAANLDGTPVRVAGECFVWGSLDANARSAPQTSKS
jgi:hypothetical protein